MNTIATIVFLVIGWAVVVILAYFAWRTAVKKR